MCLGEAGVTPPEVFTEPTAQPPLCDIVLLLACFGDAGVAPEDFDDLLNKPNPFSVCCGAAVVVVVAGGCCEGRGGG